MPRTAARPSAGAERGKGEDNAKNIINFKPHNMFMRLSCIFCSVLLIFLGICGGIYALSGADALSFICMGNGIAVRSLLAAGGVCALFLCFALAVLKPYKGLK